jgi:glutathione S-transferase
LSYHLHKIDASFDKNILDAISPNGNLPALTDIHPNGHKAGLNEAGAIAQYLVNTYDRDHRISFPQHTPEEIEVNNWFFFCTSRVGPSHDEAVHFQQEAPQKIPYSIERFQNKTLGLFFTLEQHLEKSRKSYLAGNKL